jgi:hypothetical protein
MSDADGRVTLVSTGTLRRGLGPKEEHAATTIRGFGHDVPIDRSVCLERSGRFFLEGLWMSS